MLTQNQILETLEISYNKIGNDGLNVLSRGLVQNYGLKKIILWYNDLQDSSLIYLAKALHQRSKLEFFKNNMINSIMESIKLLIKQENDNKELNLIICVDIVSYLPIYIGFKVDISFNNKITQNGKNALLKVINSETICGIKIKY